MAGDGKTLLRERAFPWYHSVLKNLRETIRANNSGLSLAAAVALNWKHSCIQIFRRIFGMPA